MALRDHEPYVPPVRRAREGYEIRRQIVGRIGMALFIALIVWILLTRVINPPAQAHAAAEQLPNVVAQAPADVRIGTADGGAGTALRFTTRVANRGAYDLDVLGVPRGATEAAALQCVVWVSRACAGRREAGTFTFHPAHGHWHFDGYAIYALRRLLPSGSPDPSAAGLVSGGQKISFCLMDSEPDSGGAGIPTYAACTGVWQGISAGWADRYGQHLAGQQLSIAGVADGRYAIVVALNPEAQLLETTYADNTAWRTIELSGSGTVVTALD